MISIVGNRKPLTRRTGAALAALAALLLGLLPLSALAHPLGNFSVNRYSRLEVGTNALLVRYVLDMAEVPPSKRCSASTSIATAKSTTARRAPIPLAASPASIRGCA